MQPQSKKEALEALERLQKIVEGLPEDKPTLPEKGWVKHIDRGDIYYKTGNGYSRTFGFEGTDKSWYVSDGYEFIFFDGWSPCPLSEVESMIREQIKERGYEPELKIKSLTQDSWIEKILGEQIHPDFLKDGYVYLGFCCIMKDGVWADIVEDKLTVNGEEAVISQSEESALINSRKFNIHYLIAIEKAAKDNPNFYSEIVKIRQKLENQ